ncbi:MAG: molybdate ABC transporter substrate-binding protein [Desulfovibrio sp.]|uniref:molybdate ABC transporter substrate-binding protein n=1 Tax=Desulfovibrio sp. TaxID=885 RepID=UPI00135D9C48|nr:molybdate ABC transporter substrate-binding protein [Desulfovibrio sp.]MTJ93697.1 molybdate ABC transporter substrate-binding protein [Desulfovibrio sp.]
MKPLALPERFCLLCALVALHLIFAQAACAGGPAITTGLGYKPMVQQLCAAYAAQTGMQPTEMYSGNIGQIIEQARAGSSVSIIVSEKASLQESGLAFAAYKPLGEAVLVLAWRKGLHLASPQDLNRPEFARIGYPDAKAAIYGRAAVAFMKGNNLFEPLKPRLSMLATVPQVFSYLVSGDLDAAFVNEAVARKQGDSLGGWMEVRDGYTPLLLVAGVVAGQDNNAEVRSFLQFLNTPEAQRILAGNGLRPVHAAE